VPELDPRFRLAVLERIEKRRFQGAVSRLICLTVALVGIGWAVAPSLDRLALTLSGPVLVAASLGIAILYAARRLYQRR
jgi:hypothetical protein